MKKPSIVNQSHSRVYIFPNHFHPDTREPASSQSWDLVVKGLQPEIDNLKLQNLLYPKIIPCWDNMISPKKQILGIIINSIEIERVLRHFQGILSILAVPILRDHFWGFQEVFTKPKQQISDLMITGIQMPAIDSFEMLKLSHNDNALKYVTVTISSASVSDIAYLCFGISPGGVRGMRGVRVWGYEGCYISAHWNYSLRKSGTQRWVTSSAKIHPLSNRLTNKLKCRRC